MSEATAAHTPGTRRHDALYVHLRLETAGAEPFLANDEITQAAATALAGRVRMLRCEVLAINGSVSHMEMTLRFPASLSLNHLVRIARETTAAAVARALTFELGRPISPEKVWTASSELHTLSRADLQLAQRGWVWADEQREARPAPGPHVV